MPDSSGLEGLSLGQRLSLWNNGGSKKLRDKVTNFLQADDKNQSQRKRSEDHVQGIRQLLRLSLWWCMTDLHLVLL